MGGTGQDDRRHKKAYARMGPLKNEAFCMQNGNTKGPVLLTGSLRYNQFLVIWGVCPRTRQQAGFLAERSTPTAAFPGKHPVTDAKAPWRQAPLSQ